MCQPVFFSLSILPVQSPDVDANIGNFEETDSVNFSDNFNALAFHGDQDVQGIRESPDHAIADPHDSTG